MKDESIAESNQPESIEDMITGIIDEAEQEETVDDPETEDTEESVEDTEEPEESEEDEEGDLVSEDADSEDGESDETEGDTVSEDEPDTEDDKLDPPEHWAATDKEVFSDLSKEGQEFLLRRHKEMEGDYTRKTQEFSADKRQLDSIRDALAPHQAEFSRAGLDMAGAVRQLASWDTALKTGGKTALMQLAQTYGIDLNEPESDEYIDPQVQKVQTEVEQLKQLQAQQLRQAQQEKQSQLLNVIQSFKGETGADGKLLHPHFDNLQEDMTRLIQAGIASNTDLSDAYNKALALRPDLNTPRETVKPVTKKADQREIVKKAKKAATGVKSSGAVGKRNREKMTLEQEIASLIQ